MASASTMGKYAGPARLSGLRWGRVHYVPSVRQVELSLYLIALSGLLLWDVLGLAWSLVSLALVAHIVGGFVLVAFVVAPFWLQHRKRLATSRASFRALTGRAIEVSLLLLVASGVHLFFAGNDGALDARLASELHLWLTFPLLALLGLHVARASAVRVFWHRSVRRWPPAGLRRFPRSGPGRDAAST